MKSKTYTPSKRPLDKNQSSKFCQSGVKQTQFQNLKEKRKWFFLSQGHFNQRERWRSKSSSKSESYSVARVVLMTSRYHFPPSMPPFAHKFHCPLEYGFFRLRAKLGVTLCVRFPLGCILLRVVGSCLKLVKLLSQQLPTFVLFHDRRSVAQQCWIPFAVLF